MAARRTGRRLVDAPGDRRFGVLAYLVMGAIVLLILAGAVLLIRVITSDGSSNATAPTASAGSITQCTDAEWFDARAGSCVPRTVCETREVYDEASNTCAPVLPTVRSIAPASGLSTGGTEVRVTGTGFEPGASLLIDGIPARDVTVVDPTTITAVTPGSENLFPVDVGVANPDVEPVLLDNAFVYVAPPVERITAINPSRGSADGGEAVIIKGTDFAEGVVVSFFGRPATDVIVLNPSTLRVTTPAGPLGPVSVNVRNPGEAPYTREKAFRYVDQPPRVVRSVRPARGAQAGGTKVTITGSGFASGATVTFGPDPARKVTVESSTRITAVTPAGTLGPVPVGVQNPGLPVALRDDAFRYVEAPTITGIRPADGPADGGSKVTITGTGFLDGATVTIGGKPAKAVKVVSPNQITARTPAGKAGATVAVTVRNPGQPVATAKKAFVYGDAATAEPEPTPSEPPAPGLPRCRTISLAPVTADAGIDLVLEASTLFPASAGVQGARLRDADFQPTTGRVDGSILWQASPPVIFWQTPGEAGRGGTISYDYTASSCEGQGRGSVRVSSR